MNKKLSKGKNKLLFGVCSGLANYLGIDMSILRILFAVGIILSGSVLLWLYILAALILPEEGQA